ncbi:MAG TPA: TetR/AcrR family transcriptional regulator [Deltaproteobacteria bacterium]|nr:TetR/AcrR family transcriptional regulator [Deltaproteobacteria bacterium]
MCGPGRREIRSCSIRFRSSPHLAFSLKWEPGKWKSSISAMVSPRSDPGGSWQELYDIHHTMRYGPEHKKRSRRRILRRAAALFRRHGYAGVGIDRVMAAANLTRGAFYAHFPSKAALFAEVLAEESDFVRRLRSASDAREVISVYLDPDNREKVARGCTLATLTNEVPRRDAAARRAYAAQIESLASEFERHLPLADPDRRARALEAVALCVGGIGIARAAGDEELAREVLGVCRERAIAAISDEGGA